MSGIVMGLGGWVGFGGGVSLVVGASLVSIFRGKSLFWIPITRVAGLYFTDNGLRTLLAKISGWRRANSIHKRFICLVLDTLPAQIIKLDCPL